MQHAAFEASDKRIGELYQVLSYAAKSHEAAAQHEQRDSDEGEGVHADVEALDKSHVVYVAAHDYAGYCGETGA